LVLPIYISEGLERRYLLVRDGTNWARDDERRERLSPAPARWLLESALRRREPELMRALAAALQIHNEDPEELATRLLAQLAATGTIGGDLVLMQERLAGAPRLDQPTRHEPEAEEPPPPEPIAEDEPEDEPPQAKTTIRVSLFFDGTANSRANTLARETNSETYQKHKKQGSFQNDYSNVSRLETLWIGDNTFEHSYSIYVEGIATTDGEKDSILGMALGTGGTGVKAKVKAGVTELLRGLGELDIAAGEIIERIHVDAFGFSRGAAAARHFVHVVLNGDKPLQPQIEARGHTVEQLEVNFVGLFDTVASYGIKHSNDTAELNLDAIQAAKKVVQLAAAEEHRKKFRLTDISSAVGAGIGTELYLPGVHSDIGGGYVDGAEEVNRQILKLEGFSNAALKQRFERERAWLKDAGWYHESEIAAVNFWNELKVTRRGIRSEYNRIPLQYMADFASETGLIFEPVDVHHPVPPELAMIHRILNAHVAAHLAGTATSNSRYWINKRGATFAELRHDYLHFSAYYGSPMGAHAPQFSEGGAMSGERQRVVQAG